MHPLRRLARALGRALGGRSPRATRKAAPASLFVTALHDRAVPAASLVCPADAGTPTAPAWAQADAILTRAAPADADGGSAGPGAFFRADVSGTVFGDGNRDGRLNSG